MGVNSEIFIRKPEDGEFKPGMFVSGMIRYSVDQTITISKITVSLKGVGRVKVSPFRYSARSELPKKNSETFVDIDNVITKENGITLQIGSCVEQFSFQLPFNIPQSLHYYKDKGTEKFRCDLQYYIRIKFDMPGWKSAKRFKKEFTVVSNIIPRLSMEPTICGHQKTLRNILSKKHILDIKANIQSRVVRPGGVIRFNCEINNNTNVNIKAIDTKLVEIYTFYAELEEFTSEEKVNHTESRTAEIKGGNSASFDYEIKVPSGLFSVDNTKIVNRKYYVWIEAVLPVPHKNATLKIEVQIGDQESGGKNMGYNNVGIEAPPSYWEVMNEETKDIWEKN